MPTQAKKNTNENMKIVMEYMQLEDFGPIGGDKKERTLFQLFGPFQELHYVTYPNAERKPVEVIQKMLLN